MPRFLIQVDHGDEYEACVRSLHAIQQYGSHLVTHADWGCKDDVHSCWLVVECEDREEAQMMVPPDMRHEARVIMLNRFTPDEIVEMMAELDG